MKYKIFGLMFLFSVSLFGIDFEQIRNEPKHQDSTGLDTTAYSATLEKMYINEEQNKQRYLDLAEIDSIKSVRGVAECQLQMDAIAVEMLRLSGADSIEIADISEDSDFNLAWGLIFVPVAAGIAAVRQWRKKRKEAKA